jgi:phage baseplate assembly protein W
MAIIQRKDLYKPSNVQPELFSDFLNDFGIHPIKKDLTRRVNEDAVKQSLRNIILTRTGERLYNPNFGSQINSLLFEQFSETTQSSIKSAIETAIKNHEPRANLIEVRVEGDIDTNSMLVTIIFAVINKEEPVTLQLILNRIR